MAGHPGRYKTQELITRNYWWLMISRDVKAYTGIDRCEACKQMKVVHEPMHAPLHPHLIPQAPWEKISVNLIGPLPESNGYDMIMMVVDWLTKTMVAIPTNSNVTTEVWVRYSKIVPAGWQTLYTALDRGTHYMHYSTALGRGAHYIHSSRQGCILNAQL
jgi:hypothetical protein